MDLIRRRRWVLKGSPKMVQRCAWLSAGLGPRRTFMLHWHCSHGWWQADSCWWQTRGDSCRWLRGPSLLMARTIHVFWPCTTETVLSVCVGREKACETPKLTCAGVEGDGVCVFSII